MAVAAGSKHSCALRADDSVLCWGNNNHGQSDPPEGAFTSISVGDRGACALARYPDTCYRYDHVPPDDSGHTCGLRPDRSVVCWGNNQHGQTDAPEGDFTAISAGAYYSCGLRPDGSVVCWGNRFGRADAPEGDFAAVSAGSDRACGLRPNGAVVCWGSSGRPGTPRAGFVAVSAGREQSCGIAVDGTITCWGSDTLTNRPRRIVGPPASIAVSVGDNHSCVLRTDDTVACWGSNAYEQADAPEGRFSEVSAGSLNSCARRADDDTIVCWGKLDHGELDRPAVAPPPNVQWQQDPADE